MAVGFKTYGHEDKFWNLGPMPRAQRRRAVAVELPSVCLHHGGRGRSPRGGTQHSSGLPGLESAKPFSVCSASAPRLFHSTSLPTHSCTRFTFSFYSYCCTSPHDTPPSLFYCSNELSGSINHKNMCCMGVHKITNKTSCSVNPAQRLCAFKEPSLL